MGDLAGEAWSQPEPCTGRYWSTITSVLGRAVCPGGRVNETANIWTTKAVLVQFIDKLDWVFAFGSGCVAALAWRRDFVAGAWRLGGGGVGLAAFLLRFVLFFVVMVVDVPVVQVVDVGVQFLDTVVDLPVVVQVVGLWFRQCSPWSSAVAVLGQGGLCLRGLGRGWHGRAPRRLRTFWLCRGGLSSARHRAAIIKSHVDYEFFGKSGPLGDWWGWWRRGQRRGRGGRRGAAGAVHRQGG